MNETNIEWVKNPDGSQGYTWNPITGCLNHDNGLCKGGGFPCYAYKLANGIGSFTLKGIIRVALRYYRRRERMEFRKKPVVIEAVQWTGENLEELWAFTGMKFQRIVNDCSIIIPTLEGDHKANKGDWIIKGVQGEFYPCKPDIFEQTYEPVASLPDGMDELRKKMPPLVTDSKYSWGNEETAKKQRDADIKWFRAYFQKEVEKARQQTRDKINEMLKPAGLHLCWITEDGDPEPLSYGLADEDGDEIDTSQILKGE